MEWDFIRGFKSFFAIPQLFQISKCIFGFNCLNLSSNFGFKIIPLCFMQKTLALELWDRNERLVSAWVHWGRNSPRQPSASGKQSTSPAQNVNIGLVSWHIGDWRDSPRGLCKAGQPPSHRQPLNKWRCILALDHPIWMGVFFKQQQHNDILWAGLFPKGRVGLQNPWKLV